MKIPHKHSNTKRLVMLAGTIALVGGVSAPFAAYAHGGSGHDNNKSSRNDSSQRKNADRVSDRSKHFLKDKSKWHDRMYWGFLGWDGWSNLNADQFADRNTKLQAKLDAYIASHGLNVENGVELKADVNTKAEAVKAAMVAQANVRDSIDDLSTASPEQRVELRAASVATFEAYYDYKLAVYDYTLAIKAAAKSSGDSDTSALDS